MSTTIVIGWTNSDMDKGYSSFMDGYRPGAEQHVETLTLDVPSRFDDQRICEAAFTATNAPGLTPRDGLAYAVEQAIRTTGYRGEGAHYSLSTGDTVTIDGRMWQCVSVGWEQVNP